MSYNLQFYTKNQFINASRSIASLVYNKNFEQVSLNLHDSLFKGGSTEPKSITQMLSIGTPSSTVASDSIPDSSEDTEQTYERIKHKRTYSLYGIVSLLEGIPVIGSVIAILSCLGHLFAMALSKEQLEGAVKTLNLTRMLSTDEQLAAAKEVHTYAVDYARHDYYLQGSALAIFPFLKPLLRLTQAAAYACGERPAAQIKRG